MMGQMMSISSHSSQQQKKTELVPFIPVFLNKNGQHKRIVEHKAKGNENYWQIHFSFFLPLRDPSMNGCT